MQCDILVLSGLWNSGPEHWQSQWERKYPAWSRVAHRDWSNPQRDEWVAELDGAIAGSQGRPILLAHSLGCMLAAQWALSGSPLQVAGAFLVAPADPEASTYPLDPNGFAPVPLARLPFPSMIVASNNDPYAHIERTRAFAAAWGSRMVEIGDAGHVNADSGYGAWPQGEAMLEEFCRDLRP
jgi:predicted alpha/beta hydrolase family esterase